MSARSLPRRRIATALLVFVVVSVTWPRHASADFIPIFRSASNGTYVYDLSFTTNGSEYLVSGDYITIYDIAPAGQFSVDFQNTGFSLSRQMVGSTQPDLIGASGLIDDPSLENLTIVFFGQFLDHPARRSKPARAAPAR
jgi:hypothetical protein